jgi:uncharacterized protein (DUF2236 family)
MASPLSPEVIDGFPFSDDAMVRRVHSEGVLLLGGGRALLMQIAHPDVARGVAEHSRFREERFGRLLRTLRPMFAIAFGTREQALAAAANVNRVHEDVVGQGYRASDPALLLWVLATLIDTTIVMYERFVRLLTPDEAAAYYEDMRKFGLLFGLKPDEMPPTIGELRAFVEEMSTTLRVSDEAQEIASTLFAGNLLLAPVMAITRELTTGLLHPALREQYGLSWGPGRESALRVFTRGSRLVLPRVPRRLRAPPWFVMPAKPSPSSAPY